MTNVPMRNCRARHISSFVISLSFRHSSFVIAIRCFAIVTTMFGACTLSLNASARDTVDLVLPTDNDALFSGDGAAFYQYVERDYKGAKSTPWEGGRYGFVRDPVDTAGGTVYTRFHEGIDIRPLHRDTNGDPLDEVRAIAGRLELLQSLRTSKFDRCPPWRSSQTRPARRHHGLYGNWNKPGARASPFGIGLNVQPPI